MNRILNLAITALACMAFSCPAQQDSAPRVTASLRDETTVEGRIVRLSDIAELRGPVPEVLARVPLTEAPQPGSTLHLSRGEVLRLLHEGGVKDILVTGADSVTIEAAAQALDSARVVAAAKDELSSALKHDGTALELTPEEFHEVKLPLGSVSLRARTLPPVRVRSRMTVWVDVALDGGFYRAVPVSFHVSAVESVLVARAGLARGAVPNCATLEKQLRDVAELAAPPQAGDCTSLGRRLRRDLSAGDVVLADELEDIPAVSEGDVVTLEISNGAVRIESRALALTGGQIGQRIAVRATASEESVLATVVAPGIVNLNGR